MSEQPAVRAQPRTWVVVLATAGVMTAIGIAFVLGTLTGAFLTRDTGDTQSASPPRSDDSHDDAAGPLPGGPSTEDDHDGGGHASGPAGSLDPCLVGTWEGTEHTEDWTTDQGDAQLSGLRRTMSFAADGTQTITYDRDEATITTEHGAFPAVFDGKVVYRATTSGGAMSFDLRSAEGTVTIDPAGATKVEELKPGTGDVRYTCDDTNLRQEAEGYLSVYERAG